MDEHDGVFDLLRLKQSPDDLHMSSSASLEDNSGFGDTGNRPLVLMVEPGNAKLGPQLEPPVSPLGSDFVTPSPLWCRLSVHSRGLLPARPLAEYLRRVPVDQQRPRRGKTQLPIDPQCLASASFDPHGAVRCLPRRQTAVPLAEHGDTSVPLPTPYPPAPPASTARRPLSLSLPAAARCPLSLSPGRRSPELFLPRRTAACRPSSRAGPPRAAPLPPAPARRTPPLLLPRRPSSSCTGPPRRPDLLRRLPSLRHGPAFSAGARFSSASPPSASGLSTAHSGTSSPAPTPRRRPGPTLDAAPPPASPAPRPAPPRPAPSRLPPPAHRSPRVSLRR
ncbi:hypothetical protein U9M48_030650 [Paspalum notatum var. saurae]|uniref:Uncharacterized protein n=1 Tax=Paspalum notatum var. saurae TaxID=547442 RepID=A0AAQ3U1C5_PASNO